MSNIAAKFVERAIANPHHTALLWHQQAISYSQLHSMVTQSSDALACLGPGPVCIQAPKSPASIAAILAALQAGRPALFAPDTFPSQTVDGLIGTTGCHAAWTAEGWQPAGQATRALSKPILAETALLLPTSGSTGAPKIVPIGVAAATAFADWAHTRFGLGADRRVLNYAPLNFDLCLLDVWGTLQHGGCVVLIDKQQSTDANALREVICASQPHVIQAVPLLFELLTSSNNAKVHCFPSVEHLISTGDVIRMACVRALPPLFPQARVYNLYGCTETNDSFMLEVDFGARMPSSLPLGQALPGVKWFLRGDSGIVDGLGTGELHVWTPFQTEGYLQGQADRFAPHPADLDSLSYFKSGDLVRRHEDGTLTLEGRTDFQVKVRGQRVNLQEVEGALRQHRAVLDAVAVVVSNPPYGDQLHVVVRRAGGDMVNSLDLRRHCVERLPSAAVPATLRFSDSPFPATSTGKPDRKAIRAEVMRHLEEAKES